jgi:hypothetical protein
MTEQPEQDWRDLERARPESTKHRVTWRCTHQMQPRDLVMPLSLRQRGPLNAGQLAFGRQAIIPTLAQQQMGRAS